MKKEKCTYCNGEGEIWDVEGEIQYNGIEVTTVNPCPKCHGFGHLDWIEQVVGKGTEPNVVYPPGYV